MQQAQFECGPDCLCPAMAVKAIVDSLGFPLKELSWDKLPEVAAATSFNFSAACDLLRMVVGEPPSDVETKLNCFVWITFVWSCFVTL